jgi:hypothetical protein
MSMYHRNKRSYLELQSSGILQLPSASTLVKCHQSCKLVPVICADVYVRLASAWKLHCIAKTHHKSTEILVENDEKNEKNEHTGEIFREENSNGLYFHHNTDNDVHDIDLADVCTSDVEFENIDVFNGNKIQQQNE